jgi:sn-glycerol 3-phosphate transport system permease protein
MTRCLAGVWNNLIYAGATIPLSIASRWRWRCGERHDDGADGAAHRLLHADRAADDRGGHLWLFFYTPDYGLLDQATRFLFGWGPTNWIGQRETALGAMIVVAVWKEAGSS